MSNNGIESHRIKINGHQAHYLKAGSGPPVVLIHGGASDATDWTGTMESLGSRYSFYAIDLPGYGKSDRQDRGYYLEEMTDAVAGFIEALKLKGVVMAGHSLGGRFCIEVAMRQPNNVSKLILIDTTGLGRMSLWGNALQYVFWGIRKLTKAKQPYPTYRLKPGESFHNNYAKELSRLKIPTYLIWKGLDPYMPLGQAKQAVKKIPGAKLIVLKGYGHAPHQKNPAEFIKIFTEVLADR